jgi:heme exporter protein C
MWAWFYRLASPPHFFRLSEQLAPWLLTAAFLLIVAGTYGGLVLAPPDYQQGDGFRIIYVHVPSAYLATIVYVTMAVTAGIGVIWRIKLAHAVAASCAAIGASFTFAALVTGAIWGKRMWGTYWEWDPRLTSFLVLFLIYLGYLSLRAAIDDVTKADRASAVLALAGLVNIPIIKFSVEWWASIHQGPIFKATQVTVSGPMLWPLLVNLAGFTLFFLGVLCIRVRAEVLEREYHARWARELLRGPGPAGVH